MDGGLNTHTNTSGRRRHSLLSKWQVTIVLVAVWVLPLRCGGADDNGIEDQLRFTYVDNALMLRHFYSGEHLRFHSDGTLNGDAAVGPWTLDGKIAVKEVHLQGGLLIIKGRRIHQIFDSKSKAHDELTTVDQYSGKDRVAMEEALNNRVVEIEIELPTEKPNREDVAAAINKVFLAPWDSMTEIVPSYWQAYFAKQEGKPQTATPPKKDPVYSIKPGEISPPHVTFDPDPPYSAEAQKSKYQGMIVVSLIVDPAGTPRDLQIQRPLGMGLDEKAVAAISTWKFEPAQKDGKPVAVAIDIEVSFRLY